MNIQMIQQMKHSPLYNYIVPGLTSWLIGGKAPTGACVRLFEMEREQMEFITPHSHRFDFECIVLSGTVENTIWTPYTAGDEYDMLRLEFDSVGKYETSITERKRFHKTMSVFKVNEQYRMDHGDIHSIKFSKGACVLFFEGPTKKDHSFALQPVANGESVPTFKTEPWMFKR